MEGTILLRAAIDANTVRTEYRFGNKLIEVTSKMGSKALEDLMYERIMEHISNADEMLCISL